MHRTDKLILWSIVNVKDKTKVCLEFYKMNAIKTGFVC